MFRRVFGRLLSVLLTLLFAAMIANNLNLSARSAETFGSFTDDRGGEISWDFEERSGTLTFSGNGMIGCGKDDAPWDAFADRVRALVVEDGVTGISEGLFCNYPVLCSVSLGSTLERIGAGAFSCCSSLTSLNMPESLQSNGSDAADSSFDIDGLRLFGEFPSLGRMFMSDDDASCCDPVRWAIDAAITTGTSVEDFSPDEVCTRAQSATFIWRALGSPEPSAAASSFTDIPKDSCYRKAVLWATESGIASGTSATAFEPDAPCTRAQAVTFLWRAAGQPKPGHRDAGCAFRDVAKSDFFYDAICWAVSEGITNGTSGTAFSPEKACTREQVVTFLFRARGALAASPLRSTR